MKVFRPGIIQGSTAVPFLIRITYFLFYYRYSGHAVENVRLENIEIFTRAEPARR
jgi:hypothetical protein